MLSAVPSVGLADASECRQPLRDAFAQSDVSLLEGAEVRVALRGARPFELSLTRGSEVVLRRELNGTCDEAARATVVVVGRWLSTLPSPPLALSTRRGEPAGHSANGSTDAGIATSRESGGAVARGDAGSPSSQEPRGVVAVSASDTGRATAPRLAVAASDAGIVTAREPGVAVVRSAIDAGPLPSVAVAPRAIDAGLAVAWSPSDAGVATAGETRVAVVSSGSDAGIVAAREPSVAVDSSAGDPSRTSSVAIESAQEPRADAGTDAASAAEKGCE